MEDKHQQMAYPFRMPNDVRTEAQKLADKNDRSLNWQLNQLVLAGLKAVRGEQNAAQ